MDRQFPRGSLLNKLKEAFDLIMRVWDEHLPYYSINSQYITVHLLKLDTYLIDNYSDNIYLE